MPSPGYIKLVHKESDQAPRLLAKTFVQELVKSGYSQAQIILIAAEILSCLNNKALPDVGERMVSIAT
ncbi:hypothetical protein JW905_05915 [bacterium]|nr:hypothetical protein [candidate division CSSED10-310 bacterium]